MWISGDMSKLEQPLFSEMNDLNRIKKVIINGQELQKRQLYAL